MVTGEGLSTGRTVQDKLHLLLKASIHYPCNPDLDRSGTLCIPFDINLDGAAKSHLGSIKGPTS